MSATQARLQPEPHDVRRAVVARHQSGGKALAPDPPHAASPTADVGRRGAVFIKSRVAGEQVDAQEIDGRRAPGIVVFQEQAELSFCIATAGSTPVRRNRSKIRTAATLSRAALSPLPIPSERRMHKTPWSVLK